MDLKSKIREIDDFPVEGINFKDITTLLQDGEAFAAVIDKMVDMVKDLDFDVIVSPEARGFIVGAPLATALRKPFVPVRKPNKLPYEVVRCTYDLEYGTDTLEVHVDGISKGMKVLIVDDLLATGGTINAINNLVHKMEATVCAAVFVMELDFLNARQLLGDMNVLSVLHYDY